MRIAICDDDIRDQEVIIHALHSWDPTRNAECFINGASLLKEAQNNPPFDILFLDIYMPNENGIEIAKAMRGISPETEIVFVTTSTEHAVDAFSLYALHYLVKPVTTAGIVESFRRLAEVRFKPRKRITFTAGGVKHTLYLDQICLLESNDHFVNVSLADGRRLRVCTSLNMLEKKLDKSFLRINRGIVVNMEYIAQMRTGVCILQDGIQLPIAVRQNATILSAYNDYVFQQLPQRNEFE